MAKAQNEHEITELRLGLPGDQRNEKKRVFSEIGKTTASGDDTAKKAVAPPLSNKVAAVGWPPVCSYRRKSIGSEKDCQEASKRLIKISMDGVPFLRKIDVNDYQDYSALIVAVEKLFGCSGIGEALKDADNSEYAPIYEDKDGDWLLIGDVPWNMFVDTCKRLRIMRRSDAKGFGLPSKKLFQG